MLCNLQTKMVPILSLKGFLSLKHTLKSRGKYYDITDGSLTSGLCQDYSVNYRM